jgi:hypothetical protein
MSADLFAEFAAEPVSKQGNQPGTNSQRTSQPPPDFSFFDNLNTAPAPVPVAQPHPSQHQFQSFESDSVPVASNDDTDDWGDFEGGSSNVESAPPMRQDPFAFTSQPVAQPKQNTTRISSNIQDPFGYDHSQTTLPDQSSWQKAPVIKAKKSADPSVLFDAEDDLDDDDDFGDFEGTDSKSDPTAPATASSALVDLLGDLNVSQPPPPSSAAQASSNRTRATPHVSMRKKSPIGAFSGMAKPERPVPKTNPAPQAEDDAWDTFDDWEASIPTNTPANTSSKRMAKEPIATNQPATPTTILSLTTDDPLPGELPPTNVPPPGVLLSLFPSLFADAQEKLFKPMAAQTLPMRNKLMAEPATINYLQGYLVLANVAAHIIAGRKLRWKRDQHLSQGMRIGPASSRATSGMKLTGIDKGENMKEEREASDVVRVWKEQVGRLRHVVSGTNQIKAGTLGLVPDLQETMPVKTLKQSEGGIPARQPCMMCGLKREERVTATDMAIDDSFGEWWIDQVNMHRGEFDYNQVCSGHR